jgi:hypothetical protein
MATVRFQIEYKGSVSGVTMNKNLQKGYSGYPFDAKEKEKIIEYIKDNFKKNWGVPFTILIDQDGVKESIEVLT